MPPHSRKDQTDTTAPAAAPVMIPVPLNPLKGWGITVRVNGVDHPFRGSEVSWQDWQALRFGLGVTEWQLRDAFERGLWNEVDLLAAVVFLSRRQNGEPGLSDPAAIADHIAAAEEVGLIPDGGGDASGGDQAAS